MQAAEVASARPFDSSDLAELFDRFADHPALLLAVSGGPDSMGLLAAVARWRQARPDGPALHVATVDHAIRPESADECAVVEAAARHFDLPAATLVWHGVKPKAGLQREARAARYRLLAAEAKRVGAGAIVTAHTISDQAETVLMRFLRGSGPLGLKAMAEITERDGVAIIRPFLWETGDRLKATALAAGLTPVQDPSNIDDRFTRVRLRKLIAAMAGEGLDIERLATFAGRMRLLDEALRHQAAKLAQASLKPTIVPGTQVFEAQSWLAEPLATVQMLLSRAIEEVGDSEVAERLAAIEELSVQVLMALAEGRAAKTTLRGAVVAVTAEGRVIVSREPMRRAARE
ncbi:tRNA lysidine(34) synthetase TilS [Phreatobacter stygius]|uniref:tRNA lysidine(34) synthetase TilS n=1 Tax=Phreatobacter stygius TaxID=1940610 RepID=UPI001476CF28|nr:tRNA lysidine(34) synthetase TilS [Phreatobacter stygius]